MLPDRVSNPGPLTYESGALDRLRYAARPDGGMFVEMDRGGVLTYGKKTINVRIVHSQICLRI